MPLVLGMALAGCPAGNEDPTDANPAGPDPLEGKILILQAYGTGEDTDGAGVSHSFVELYNTTSKAVNLNGYSLQYAAGTRGDPSVTADGTWEKITFTGSHSIPAGGSFLILGAKKNTAARLQIADAYGDINSSAFILSNRAFKAALVHSTETLTAQNPFNTDGSGTKAAGYIDMLGAVNTPNDDVILGFETALARISKSVAARRTSLADTNDNYADFEQARYAQSGGGMSNEAIEVKRPRNSTAGQWDPMQEPEEPVPSEGLMIFQVYGTGPTPQDGSVSHTFVELYNNSDAAIPLSAYSLQYADGISSSQTAVADWTVINLTGTIPAHGSYLIRGAHKNTENNQIGRLQVAAGDQEEAAFTLSNRSYKVALLSSQVKLTIANPFDTDGSGTKAAGYVDMVGALNGSADSIDGYEGAVANIISKQKAIRRSSLTDTDNNLADFKDIDYRTADLDKFKPRAAGAGAWTPTF